MADPVLITTPTRPFSWAMSDLTLFGGQPTPGMVIGRAPTEVVTADEQTVSLPVVETESGSAASDTTALLGDAAPPPEMGEAQPIALAVTSHPAAASTEPLAPAASTGSSGLVAPFAMSSLQVVNGHEESGASIVAPLVSTPSEAVEPLAQPITTDLPHTIDMLAGTETVDRLIGPAAELPDAVSGALGGVGSVAHSAFDTNPLDAFAGSDPAAGLSTLVGMIASADAFDLGQTVAPASDAGSGSILDALSSDALPSPLLGDDHHVAGDLPVDDHSIHVGL